jgi:hypothetical protein
VGDEQWREAERRWRTSPSDETLAAAIKAGRRHGARIPGELLLAQRFPRRTFSCKEQGWVRVEVDGGLKALGYTPKDAPIAIPRHATWWFQTLQGAATVPSFDQLLKLAVREQIPGLGVFLPKVSDRDLAQLGTSAPDVTGLSLSEKYSSRRRPLTEAVFAAVAKARRLQRLRVAAGVDPNGRREPTPFSPLRDLPELVDLEVGVSAVSRDLGGQLPRFVRRLALRGFSEPWPRMRGVEAALEGLGLLEELVDLELQYADATDEGLSGFLSRSAQRLERLSIEGCIDVIGDAFGKVVAPRLRMLDLHSTAVTDRALAQLPKVTPALERLKLTTCKAVGDAGLGHVAKLTTLRELDLDHCTGVTSKGLVKLADLKGLERLYLRGSPGTLATWGKGRDKLRKALPDCKIY